jgi:hypothetical protein
MRNIIFCTIVLSFALSASAQQTGQKATVNQENYFDKSKKQKKVGRILLAVGAGLLITGAVIPQGELTEEGIPGLELFAPDKHKNDGVKTVFITGGVITALASIPFFIVSKKNSRRAASMGFRLEKSKNIIDQQLVSIPIPALAFKVNL